VVDEIVVGVIELVLMSCGPHDTSVRVFGLPKTLVETIYCVVIAVNQPLMDSAIGVALWLTVLDQLILDIVPSVTT